MLTQDDLRDVEQPTNPFIKALLFDVVYEPGTVITYVLQGNAGDTNPYGGALWSTDGRRDAINQALTAWSNVANITFVESDTPYDGTGDTTQFDWIESMVDLDAGLLGQHNLPYPGTLTGEFNLASGAFTGVNLLPGGLGFSTLLHELGHALGLLHPHTEGGGGWDFGFPGVGDPFDSGSFGLNQGVFTVMTYLDGYEEVGLPLNEGMGYSAGLGAFDIAAIQYLYGANMSYHTGNDTYLLPDANVAGTGWMAIWDAGGTDTISAAGSNNDVIIDLRPATLLDEPGGGGWASRAFGILGGFTIANGVVIENATGGNGDDIFVGNILNNVIDGGSGFDVVDYSHLSSTVTANLATGTMTGEGNDTLTGVEGLLGGSGNDVLTASNQTTFTRATGLLVADGTQGGSGIHDALSLTPYFGDAFPNSAPDASGGYLVATIGATGRNQVDYFSFTVGPSAAGTQVIIDIDASFAFDSFVRLLDASGNIIAVSDDRDGDLDKGSASFLDSYLVFDLPNNLLGERTYYIQVGSYTQSETSASAVRPGSSYTMHVVAIAEASGRQTFNSYLDGGDGDDLLTGGAGRDHLFGGLGIDVLVGNGGNDLLEGGAGDDFIYASTGMDMLVGGSGNDTYFIRDAAALDAIIVEERLAGSDLVLASVDYELSANLEDLVLVAASGAVTGIGNAERNDIAGNENGNQLFGMMGNDVIRGGAGDDTIDGGGDQDEIYGDDGDDTLFGGDSHDELIGGAGHDTFYGGGGNDTYYLDDATELVFEDQNAGEDGIFIEASFYLYVNVERLQLLGDGDFYGVGNELDNTLSGNNEMNLLIGHAGNDDLYGRDGDDLLFGGDGDDLLAGSYGLDYLVGGHGNDELSGGAGPDAIYGEDGDDVLVSDYQTGPHGDSRHGGVSVRHPEPTFDTDILVGGAGNDTLYGNSGLGDYDLLYGNEGDDTFYVDTPDDLVFEQAGEGYDIVYADINGAGYYLYGGIEELVLLGNTPFGVGNDLNNILTGNNSNNWLLGGDGNDRIDGGIGYDVLFGEAGDDVFVFNVGTAADVVGDFTQGEDLIDLSAYEFASFAELQKLFVQDGDVGGIILGGTIHGTTDVVILHNVQMDQLTADDFIL